MVKKILSFFSATFLILLCSLTVQAQEADYFSHRLIIKYESEQKLQQIKARQKADPKSAVGQLLHKYGVHDNRPLLSDRLRQSIRQKRLPSSDEVLRIREISFSQRIDPVQLAAKISRMPGVVYAEPKYIRRMSITPNDPKLPQKFVDTHNFAEAWNISQGSTDIIIAIVDGGVGYTHPELDENLWVNQDEIPPSLFPQVDQNGDGTVTSGEINQYLQDQGDNYNGDETIDLQDALHDDSPFTDNADNDGNGFADDLFGWDFWAGGTSGSNIIQDNNPFHDASDHGTHVAGIAAAETNNGEGIASAAFNATYMPIKVGGIASNPNAIGFGFEGILYAAEQGADIINCSWGGSSFSEAEEDIINLATEMGSLVVVAAGNDNNRVDYPARYDQAFAVGAIESNLNKALYSNFGYNLDVLATGTDILSTTFNDDYISKSGTSMSTPVVSGLAALVKEIHPDWSPERIGMQIRASATDIDDVNGEALGSRLGRGSVDAFKALDTNLPGLKAVSFSFVDSEGDKLLLGESGSVNITLTNAGNTTSSLELQLVSLNDSEVELGGSQQLGSVATGDTVEVSFDLTIPDNFDLREIPTFRLNFIDDGHDYNDFSVLLYEKFFYDVVDANNVKTSFGAEGTIGFSDPLNTRGGVGFIPRTPDGSGGYDEGSNLLFEGGLIVEFNGELYDAVRTTGGNVSRDFFPQKSFSVRPTDDGNGLIGNTEFVTIGDSASQAVIDLQTYAFDDPGISNVVFVRYTIQNPSPYVVMDDLYAGIFNDWDIGNNPGNNNISYSEADSILYISDASASSNQPVVAVAHMGPISGALAIDNTVQGRPDSVTFGLYDGFTDGEKSSALTSRTVRTDLQNTDVSAVTASGPYILNPGAEISVGFIYAFGDDVDQLRNQIAEARSRNLFSVSPAGRAVSDQTPGRTELVHNFPNPFHGKTQIHINLEESMDIKLTIYDTLGRKVRVLADGEFEAGSHFIPFNPDGLSSGVYFAHLVTDQNTDTIGMTFIK